MLSHLRVANNIRSPKCKNSTSHSLIAQVTCLIALVTSQHSDFWALFTDRFIWSQLRDSTFVSLVQCISSVLYFLCILSLLLCFFLACQLVDSQREPVQPCRPVNICSPPATACWLFHRVFFGNFHVLLRIIAFLLLQVQVSTGTSWPVPTTWYLMSLKHVLADDSNYQFRWLLRHL